MSHFNLLGAHWTTQTTVTWSIATQNFSGQPGGNFSHIINDPIIVNDISRAFAIWDAASSLSFQRVADSADVDIRFGYGVIDGQGGVLAVAYPFANGGSFTAVTISFDVGEDYFIQNGEVYFGATVPITNAALHEIGHALGLDHYEGELAIMNSVLGPTVTLQSSDLHGIHFLYGPGEDDDILWRHQDGAVVTWEVENGQLFSTHSIAFASTGWEIVNSGDFDADGDSDILWRHQDGAVVTWEMESGAYVQNHNIAFASVGWTIQSLGDFDADGDSDIIWRHRDGAVVTWEMEDGAYVINHNIAFASTGWEIRGTGDFDGDADSDILWRHTDGAVVMWEMENGAYVSNHNIAFASTGWEIDGIGDFGGDGDSDILWRHQGGQVVTWEMQGGEFASANDFGSISTAWQITGTGDVDLA
jgi:hypothetical protein